jgi:hypothetical protein
MLARDIIDWDAVELQSHNLSAYTRDSAAVSPTTYYINGTPYLPQDPNPVFGAAGSGAEYEEGEIVVTGVRSHSDQSLSYRFASYDPYTDQQVSWVENVTFLDMARANADVNIIRFDLAEGEPQLSLAESDGVEALRDAVQSTIASLQQLDPNGYFQVGEWGRIRVSELISLLMRSDWTIHSQSDLDPGAAGDVDRNDGDPRMRVSRDWLPAFTTSPSLLNTYLLHEIAHATRAGWEHRHLPLSERMTNDVARAILLEIGRPYGVETNPRHGYGATTVDYNPNVPTT